MSDWIIVIDLPSVDSAGLAIVNGDYCHFIQGHWVYCGDCNKEGDK